MLIKKQSIIFKSMAAAIDQLELLLLEGEVLDMDIMESLIKRFEKLKK